VLSNTVGHFVDAGVGLRRQSLGRRRHLLGDLVDAGMGVAAQIPADLGDAIACLIDFAIGAVFHDAILSCCAGWNCDDRRINRA
jgi:hypothetical protein